MRAPVATLPVDANYKNSIPLVPDRRALAGTAITSLSSAVDITLTSGTSGTATFLEVSAIGKGMYLRYEGTAASNAFDEYIPADNTRNYIVPPNVGTISLIEIEASGTAVVIQK